MPGLLALKLFLVPALIAIITLAGRRWGAAVAGALAGFPVVTGPILLFVAIEQGGPFASEAAVAAVNAVLCNIAFGIAYAWTSRKAAWYWSALAGMAAFFCLVAVFNAFRFSVIGAGAVTFAGLLLAPRLFPDFPEVTAPAGKRSASDLPYRMLAGALLVIGVTVFSQSLGPNLTGLFSVFPVMGGVLAVFSHRYYGHQYAGKLLRAMAKGFYSFTFFCMILAVMLRTEPVLTSFLAALFVAIAVQVCLMRWGIRKTT